MLLRLSFWEHSLVKKPVLLTAAAFLVPQTTGATVVITTTATAREVAITSATLRFFSGLTYFLK